MSKKERLNHREPEMTREDVTVKGWNIYSGWSLNGCTEEESRALEGPDIVPLPVAIRLDIPLRVRTRDPIPASKLAWVSPSRAGHPVKVLEALLLPN